MRLPVLLTSLAMLAGTTLPLAGQTPALASSQLTMVLSSRIFPNRAQVPDTLVENVPVTPNQPITVTAPTQVLVPGNNPSLYSFAFWSIDGREYTKPPVQFVPKETSGYFNATAWYFPQCTSNNCPSGSGVTVSAFSLDQDMVVSGTPIASVSPPLAQTSATTASTSAGPVTITAANLISGSGLFKTWIQFGNGTTLNNTLTVPAHGASTAIAFYAIPYPDPCDGVRGQVDNFNAGDFSNPTAAATALAQLNRQLRACELQYGEPLR